MKLLKKQRRGAGGQARGCGRAQEWAGIARAARRGCGGCECERGEAPNARSAPAAP